MCILCGGIVESTGRGRPRKFCLSCSPRKAPRTPPPSLREAACSWCSQTFETRTKTCFCSSRCRYAARDEARKFPCAECGAPMFRASTNRPVGEATCRACKRKCGTVSQYGRGCRCLECRRAKAANLAKYLPANYTNHWIKPEQRIAIYERDGWTCQLCDKLVDLTVHHLHRDAPTLDHIEPRSLVLIPDDRPSNLRTAHRGCNSARGNRVSA